jgi:predicted phosphodiesterase
VGAMSNLAADRNAEQASLLADSGDERAFTFVVLGDTGAYPNPTADAIFTAMLRQIEQLEPQPAFLVHLGDFAGPGTVERHEHYLELISSLEIPSFCLMGNHDGENARAWETFVRIHGSPNFTFAHGDAKFVALACHSEPVGPCEEELEFLEESLADDDHPFRIVLTHAPPHLDGHYAPHPEWGFTEFEQPFLRLLQEHRVDLVCSAHIMAYDFHEAEGIRFLVSGGGGFGMCSHYGMCNEEQPPRRGCFYHFVEIALDGAGRCGGHVIKAHHGTTPDVRFAFDFTARAA